MATSKKRSFTFIVLAYNHKNYIVEHLESIKYLVLQYGNNLSVDLIITDDCSTDGTSGKINDWVSQNSDIFSRVRLLLSSTNHGTCASLVNAINELQTDICKITAGDDVYSFENIFDAPSDNQNISLISGRTLYLYDSEIHQKWPSTLFEVATDCIYKNRPLLSRFIGYNYTNAPNLFYPVQILKDPRVINFVKGFYVVEDFPLQLATAQYYPNMTFRLEDRIFVYYRRTLGSTYLVKNEYFTADIKKAYSHIYSELTYGIQKIAVSNRLFCLKIRSKLLKRLLNLETYIFIYRTVINTRSILNDMRNVKIDAQKHQSHYNYIKQCAKKYDDA